MDLQYSPEQLAFRDDVRQWLQANLPADLKDKVASYLHLEKEEVMRWHRILAGKGWIAPHWPVEWGGTDWDAVQRYIFEEECSHAGAPQLPGLSLIFCAPVLIAFGTLEQRQRFLPRIYSGEDFWCQGYSEPAAGSDLAALQTRAVHDGDHYVVTGHKIWTTQAHWANWMFCLVRTDPQARKKQEGISFLLIDMQSPGITVRPVILMDGGLEVNEVFLDEVKVPVANLVHKEGQGWEVAKYLLNYERLNAGKIGASKRQLAKLKDMAWRQMTRGSSLMEVSRFRDRLSRVEIELMALEITNLRYLDRMVRSGQPPGAEVSLLKIKGTAIQQQLSELMLQVAGPHGQRGMPQGEGIDSGDSLMAALAPRYFNLRKLTIFGGTDEVLRNIIAKMHLGL